MGAAALKWIKLNRARNMQNRWTFAKWLALGFAGALGVFTAWCILTIYSNSFTWVDGFLLGPGRIVSEDVLRDPFSTPASIAIECLASFIFWWMGISAALFVLFGSARR